MIGLRQDGRYDIWRHRKSGGLYLVLSMGAMQESKQNPFDELFVIYRCLENGYTWIRNRQEFLDGRFEQILEPGELDAVRNSSYLEFDEEPVDPTYDAPVPGYGDVFTVEDFRNSCQHQSLIDYDGDGNPAREENGKILVDLNWNVSPSRRGEIPASATHIVWFNR